MIEGILSFILLILLFLIVNPFDLFMLTSLQMIVVVLLVVLFAVFAVFVFREKTRDEREALHRFIAGRLAFLLGTAVLVIGIVVQTVQHTLDLWLVVALVVMILGKIGGLVYSRMKQ
ncbi:MAG: hypothetical protein HYV40_03930 [Candidatus Levybacteria bacterium]|nr:hypothetical protein [Candidatus Levybacteria bacterium]